MEHLCRNLMSALIIGSKKNDWIRIIFEIEKDLKSVFDRERTFLTGFLEWLKEALKHTAIIVVEGNL